MAVTKKEEKVGVKKEFIEELKSDLTDWDVLNSWIQTKSKGKFWLKDNKLDDWDCDRYNLIANDDYCGSLIPRSSGGDDLKHFVENVKTYLTIWGFYYEY